MILNGHALNQAPLNGIPAEKAERLQPLYARLETDRRVRLIVAKTKSVKVFSKARVGPAFAGGVSVQVTAAQAQARSSARIKVFGQTSATVQIRSRIVGRSGVRAASNTAGALAVGRSKALVLSKVYTQPVVGSASAQGWSSVSVRVFAGRTLTKSVARGVGAAKFQRGDGDFEMVAVLLALAEAL